MKPGTFDTLTKALATPTLRREALSRMAGIFGLGTLTAVTQTALSPAVALASGSNYDCIYFCESVFPAGSNRTQCSTDAANGKGLCYSAGPRSTGGSKSICCPADSNGQCTSYSSATSCGSGQTCTQGTCVSTCSGTTLLNGTCAQTCSGSPSCGSCAPDLLLGHYVTNGQGSLTLCVTDLTCPKGEFCNNILAIGVCQTAVVC